MRTIAIGLMALALAHGSAAAQTAGEQAQILRDFQESVAEYTQRDRCLDMFPEAINAVTPVPRIFTPPVAMVFRQLIARSLAERDGVAAINGVGVHVHVAVLEPFPSNLLDDFPRVLQDSLPPLPTPLEYRLIGHDLVVRDTEADIIVGVIREALGSTLTVVR
jgi:hypothetical protein